MRRIEGGSIAVLRHRGWQPAHIVETEKRAGDRVIYRGRCYRVSPDGGWHDTDPAHVSGPVAHPHAGPAMSIHTDDAGGLALIAAAAIAVAIVFWVGAHGLGWL